MLIPITLVSIALLFCAIGAFCFLKANYCACAHQGYCNNPIGRYWLGAILSQVASFALCCLALHTFVGTVLWLILICSCMGGVLISGALNRKQRCTALKGVTANFYDGKSPSEKKI